MAQGMIRIRCSACRKAGIKDNYAIDLAKDIRCNHKEIRYQALYPRPDGSQDPLTCATKGEADIFLADRRLFYHKNPNYVKRASMIFNQMADKVLADIKKSGLVDIKALSNYRSIVKCHLRPALGLKQLEIITYQMVYEIRLAVSKNSKSIQQKVNRLLKLIFKQAVLEGYITENPTNKLPKLPKNTSTTYNILEPNQIRDLLDMAKNSYYRLYYKIPIYTGLRGEEVAGLMWDCINFDEKWLEVRRVVIWLTKDEQKEYNQPNRWIIRDYPKTPAGFRRIPFTNDLVKDLEIFKIEQPENTYNLVFASPEGTPIHTMEVNRNNFKRDAKRAGIPAIQYHQLRHTFCSLLAANGVEITLAQYYMGHEDSALTQRIYTHLMDITKRKGSQIAEKLHSTIYPSQIENEPARTFHQS